MVRERSPVQIRQMALVVPPIRMFVLCGLWYTGSTYRNMSIQFIIQVVQVVSAVLLIIAILLQRGEANVGSAFGGGDVSETGNVKRRGSEKIVFIASFVIAAIFVVSIVFPLVTV